MNLLLSRAILSNLMPTSFSGAVQEFSPVSSEKLSPSDFSNDLPLPSRWTDENSSTI